MKKFAAFLMCLSVSMFALGCGGGTTKKDDKKPGVEKKDGDKKDDTKKDDKKDDKKDEK